MASELTVCLTNWARPEQLHVIIDQLKVQSCQPNIVVWNNNPEYRFKNDNANTVINSTKNVFCRHLPASWQMAGTPFVAKMDDDLYFADDEILADALEVIKAQRNVTQLVGAFGVRIYSDSTYEDGHRIEITKGHGQYQSLGGPVSSEPNNFYVDLLKGRFLLANARGAARLSCSCPHHHVDLYISMMLAGTRRMHHTAAGCFFDRERERSRLVNFPTDGKGFCDMENHLEVRNKITDDWTSHCSPHAKVIKKPPKSDP